MKRNKFTMWLFNYKYKFRIAEIKVTYSSEGVSGIKYQAQRRNLLFGIIPFGWYDFEWNCVNNYDEDPNSFTYSANKIDDFLSSINLSFFRNEEVKYIKYP